MHIATDERLQPGYAAPHAEAHGDAESALFHPPGFSLWSLRALLKAGTTISWGTDHGDEGILVVAGAIEGEAGRCEEGAAFVVEAGAPASVTAAVDSEVVHVGPAETEPPADGAFGPPLTDGRHVHVVGAEGARVRTHDPIVSRLFVDSTCPTCRITLFKVAGTDNYRSSSHSHSEDEIIHVLKGALQVGPATVAAGMSVAIGANERYGFTSKGDFMFLNYRRDVASFTGKPGTEPILESPRPEWAV